MIRNYLMVALRNLSRNRLFSAINIAGLAVSMAVCMAIIMLVADQMTYDRHNTNRERIFRVNSRPVDNQGVPRNSPDNATSPMPLRDALLNNYTGIESAVRIRRGFGNGWMELENQDVNIPVKGFWADPGIFSLFQMKFQYGEASVALAKPYSVVLTREAADKLFAEENPLGHTIKVGDLGIFTVTGILEKSSNKSHLVFEALASMSTVERLETNSGREDWMNFWDGWTYVMLEPNTTSEDAQLHLDDIYKTHIASVSNPEIYKAKFVLQSLSGITPGPFINNPIGPSLPWVFVYFLSGLASVILLTSCFNFTNLSIARSLKRAREIGVRKVTGAARWQIFLQFISESVVMSFCALALAILILLLAKPLILQLTFARVLLWDLHSGVAVYAVFGVFAIAVGVLAGMFPAVVLSGFQPVAVLKNLTNVKVFSRMRLRKGLLVTQFTVSLVFILTVMVMYNQMQLFMTKDYGFNMENNIVVRLNSTAPEALKHELLKLPGIENVSAASHVPAAGTTYGDGFKRDLAEKEWTSLNFFSVDEDYLKNLQVPLLTGRFFSPENGESNRRFVVINEKAVKAFHFDTPLDAVGQEIIYQSDSSRKTIIGVVSDYNHNPLFSETQPLALMYDPAQFNVLQVRYAGTHADAVNRIESAWKKVNPDLRIDRREMESEIKYFYNVVFGDLVNILGVISVIAIMISCLGLLGMATYSIETRMKEISLRKVLGSSDRAVAYLLSKGYVRLLAISIIIGVPLAWFVNNFWLRFLAYRTELGPGTITLGVLVLVVLGGVTIGSQTMRAIFADPAQHLKNE